MTTEATQPSAQITDPERVLKVGQRLRDGTVVLSVDLGKNKALFLPAIIFGGEAKFDHQDKVVESVNREALHGHRDWRRITQIEGETLSKVWDKVAPLELRDPNAPWFWLTTTNGLSDGKVHKGGEAYSNLKPRDKSYPVPVVRSGPAWNLEI